MNINNEDKEKIAPVPSYGHEPDEMEAERIRNRLKNLLWTVSGDYSLETEINVSLFQKSKYIALYDAICKGCFAKYFRPKTFTQYLEKVFLYGAEPSVLLPLARLCIESAVCKKAVAERNGIAQIRRHAFEDTLLNEENRLTHTDWGALEACYLRYCLNGSTAGRRQIWIDKICALCDADDTVEVIRCLDEVYHGAYPKGFADEFKGFGLFEGNPGRGIKSDSGDDENEDSEETNDRTVNLLSDRLLAEDGTYTLQKPSAIILEDESMALARNYIELNYGKSYLTAKEQRQLSHQLCTGAHKDCKLHFTDGLLHSACREEPDEKETFNAGREDSDQVEYASRVLRENMEALKLNQPAIRQNIQSLSEILRRALLTREEKEVFSDEYGKLCVSRLWNLCRTGNRKLFEREFTQEITDFAVELLIDSSGSQQIRQSMVALQGYIISEALSLAGIPHRVMGYCTFGEYTVLRRFRDYDEPLEADGRILEFYGSANNRDGLAIRAAAHSLSARREENKILIVLSDGTPNDIIVSKSKSRLRLQYCNEYAVMDTAREVLSLRNKGLSVMGIFAGGEDALPAEKKIFGSEFAYIRNIGDFSNVVGRYLKEQLLR